MKDWGFETGLSTVIPKDTTNSWSPAPLDWGLGMVTGANSVANIQRSEHRCGDGAQLEQLMPRRVQVGSVFNVHRNERSS